MVGLAAAQPAAATGRVQMVGLAAAVQAIYRTTFSTSL
jgi:hypothetical protein